MALFHNSSNANLIEVKTYFEEPIISIDSETLKYWKENEKKFPVFRAKLKLGSFRSISICLVYVYMYLTNKLILI